MEDNKLGATKVPIYSPDVQTFSFEGTSGIFGAIASLFVAPLRCTIRVMHNIALLPAPLLMTYSKSLAVCSFVLFLVGAVDYIAFRRWPLLVAEVLSLCISGFLYSNSKRYSPTESLRIVEIDTKAVEESCNDLYDKLSEITKE